MTALRRFIRLLLYAACGLAVLLALKVLVDQVVELFAPRSYAAILYSSLQLTFLNDLAKTMMPTVGGIVALGGGAIGYLHKARLLGRGGVQLGVFVALALAILSLGCWVAVFASVIDAARGFDRSGAAEAFGEAAIRYLNLSYGNAVAAAKIGALAFFSSVATITILGSYFVEMRTNGA